VKIKSIHIQNFLSIKDLLFNFEDGLHLFTGDNGAGKSTILQAVSVGLFNKCERPQPWARLDGPGGFTITTTFTIDGGEDIVVVNNRVANRFEVYRAGTLLTHQISKGLPMVADILNISYHEFTMLSSLTPTTIASILTGTDSSLISKFFNLSVLGDYEKVLVEERKGLNRDKKKLESKLLEHEEDTETYDTASLDAEISVLNDKLNAINNSEALTNTVPKLQQEVSEKNEALSICRFALKEVEDKLGKLRGTDGVCPTCGSQFLDNLAQLTILDELANKEAMYKNEIQELSTSVTTLQAEISGLTNPLITAGNELRTELNLLKGKRIASSILTEKVSIDIDAVIQELTQVDSKLTALNVTLKAIKSGAVHKSYLQTFVAVLNSKLGTLVRALDLSLSVMAKIDSKGLSFSILDNGVYKFSNVLSAGEKVMIGLLVLNAMLDTLKDTLNINISLLLLDEAVSAVSTENMYIVESVLKNLASNRCIIVTQHHEELPTSMFDYTHTIRKVDNITTIE
jgi:DNA repair exonuclease SbcCD ATPase subunit